MKRTGKAVLISAAFAFAVLPLLSQTNAPKKPAFEVVSVKPTPPGNFPRGGGPRGDGFSMSGVPLRILLQFAYRRLSTGPQIFMNGQIIGGPSWMDSDRFDVQAKADCSGGAISQDQLQLMLQSLLEDRFQLKAHLETRELPIYNLVVGKDGPKMKLSEDQTPGTLPGPHPLQLCGPSPAQPGGGQRGIPFDPRGPLPRGAMTMRGEPSGLTMSASAVPIANLVGMLQGQAGRPIVDKTDLKGLFDIKLQFSPEGLPTPFGPLAGAGPVGIGSAGAGPGPAAPAGPGVGPPTASDPAHRFSPLYKSNSD